MKLKFTKTTNRMSLYVLTLAHFSGDHCHVLGIYDKKELALIHLHELEMKHNKDQNSILEVVGIPKNKLNTLLYTTCSSDDDEDEDENNE